jgi:hypothetical protein
MNNIKLRRNNLLAISMAACITVSSSGCAVVMAAKQPDYKNGELFKVGTPRGALLGEFGHPTATDTRPNGDKCDVFSFTQGYSGGAKAGRAFLHGVADVFTLGLWEVIGTPTEAIFSGSTVGYETCYDKEDRVSKVILLTPENDGRGPKNVGPAAPDVGGSPLTPAPMIVTNGPIDQVANPTKDPTVLQSAPSAPKTQPVVTGTPQQKLQELKSLRKEGLITDAEYQQKKKEILQVM